MKNLQELEEKIGYHFKDPLYIIDCAHSFFLC